MPASEQRSVCTVGPRGVILDERWVRLTDTDGKLPFTRGVSVAHSLLPLRRSWLECLTAGVSPCSTLHPSPRVRGDGYALCRGHGEGHALCRGQGEGHALCRGQGEGHALCFSCGTCSCRALDTRGHSASGVRDVAHRYGASRVPLQLYVHCSLHFTSLQDPRSGKPTCAPSRQ